MKWSGLNRSTAHHIRIRGFAINRFLLGILLGVLGFVLVHAGLILMDTQGWDGIVFLTGVAIILFAMKVTRAWILSEGPKGRRRSVS